MLTLTTGYLNLRMVIHGVFMSLSETVSSEQDVCIQQRRQTCIDSAARVIDLIYDTFTNYTFFQTWYETLLPSVILPLTALYPHG